MIEILSHVIRTNLKHTVLWNKSITEGPVLHDPAYLWHPKHSRVGWPGAVWRSQLGAAFQQQPKMMFQDLLCNTYTVHLQLHLQAHLRLSALTTMTYSICSAVFAFSSLYLGTQAGVLGDQVLHFTSHSPISFSWHSGKEQLERLPIHTSLLKHEDGSSRETKPLSQEVRYLLIEQIHSGQLLVVLNWNLATFFP